MDCLNFRKEIKAYINQELSDEELDAFLRHLSGCAQCREELEIHYIVSEGIRILDEKKQDCNLSRAYSEMLKKDGKYIRRVVWVRILTYTIDTLAFWGTLACALMYLRIRFFP